MKRSSSLMILYRGLLLNLSELLRSIFVDTILHKFVLISVNKKRLEGVLNIVS
jgi:hypothetical protein